MSYSTDVETHTAAKRHRCSWCWQHIDPGDTYKKYRWFDSGEANTEKMHPECHVAMIDAANEEGGWLEWVPGQERPEVSK